MLVVYDKDDVEIEIKNVNRALDLLNAGEILVYFVGITMDDYTELRIKNGFFQIKEVDGWNVWENYYGDVKEYLQNCFE